MVRRNFTPGVRHPANSRPVKMQHCFDFAQQVHLLMWYMMWRVIHGLHDKILVNFMISGHTKFAPDWSFGLLKQNFRQMEVHCLDDMARTVYESAETLNRPQLVGREDGTVIVPPHSLPVYVRK